MDIIVLGLGYVGSVTAAGLASFGHQVHAIESDEKKAEALRNGKLDLYEPGLKELTNQSMQKGNLKISCVSEVKNPKAHVVIICVGTPARKDGAADLSQVHAALQWITSSVTAPTIIMMKSTVPPGTGKRLISQYLSSSNTGLSYVMNPEFLREGQALHDWFHPDRIVLGSEDPKAIDMVRNLYGSLETTIVVTDVTSAELIKYASNAFLATKISFINEIANLCDHLDADIDDVARSIGLDNRIGPSFLRAGIGYGGSCFPKDTDALNFLSLSKGVSLELLKAVINVNRQQRIMAVLKLRGALGTIYGKKIAVLGLTFKPDTDDTRESPSIDIINLLIDEGAEVKAFDPLVKNNINRDLLPNKVIICSDVFDAIGSTQALVIATEWNLFGNLDWSKAKQIMKDPYVVVDGRNCLSQAQIEKLGFKYIGFGRLKR